MEKPGEVTLDYPNGAPIPPPLASQSEGAAGTAVSTDDAEEREAQKVDEHYELHLLRSQGPVTVEVLLTLIAKGNSEAVSELSDEICHQDSVSPSTPSAIAGLVQQVLNRSTPFRSELLWLLARCARAAFEERTSPPGRATLSALAAEVPALTSFLRDEDPESRKVSALIFAAGSLAVGPARGRVLELFGKEGDRFVRAALLLALHPLRSEEAVIFAKIFADAREPLVRFVAAVMIAAANPERVTPDVGDHLRACFRERNEVLSLWETMDELNVSPVDPVAVMDAAWRPD